MHRLLPERWIRVLLSAPLLLATAGMVNAEEGALLLEAARAGDIDTVRAELYRGVDVNSAEPDGAVALHWAVLRGNTALAELLTGSGANASLANEYGVTPLWLACNNRNEEMAALLLRAGADPNAALWNGETVLMQCARAGLSGTVQVLLTMGAYADAVESIRGQTALMWAAEAGQSEVVRVLLNHGADYHVKTRPGPDTLPHSCSVCDWKPSPGGFTALQFAARSGDMATTRILLEAGADPDESTAEHGNTLVIAAAGGHIDLALFLLQMGADPNASDDSGLTALHHAVGRGMAFLNGVIYDPVYRHQPVNSPELATALIRAGANVNARITRNHLLGPDGTPFSMQGATPFLLAATAADIPMMKLLRKAGADPGIVTDEGVTALMAAAQSVCTGTCAFQEGGNVADPDNIAMALAAVQVVAEMGVDVNAATASGKTAMHIAAFTGSDHVVRYLVERGAKVEVRDANGETPWTMASGMTVNIGNRGLYGHHASTAALLLELGAQTMTLEELAEYAPPYSGR